MAKRHLPVYSIQTLKETPVPAKDFVAEGFARYLDEHRNLHFPHKHSFYQLVYFSKGAGSHSIDFVHFPVEPGQIYFMIPGQVHTWDFAKAPDGYIVNYSEDYLQALIADPRYTDQFSFFSGKADQQVITIPAEGRKPVEQVLKTIVNESKSQNRLKDDFIRAALVQLFILVSRYTSRVENHTKSNYNTALLRDFQNEIERHYKEKRLVKEYAALLHITPNHLNAVSNGMTTRSAGELIRDRVLLEAKRLLINAEMNISEIADELNFPDNSYFSRFFKRYEGVTPETFRKQFINA